MLAYIGASPNGNADPMVQTPLGARPGLGTQPRYEAPGDPLLKYVKRK